MSRTRQDALPQKKNTAGSGPAGAATDADLVECLLVAVPEFDSLAMLTPALADLVTSSAIGILDLVCVARSASDGRLTVAEIEDVRSIAALGDVDGDVGGLLSRHDIEQASLALEVGQSAILLLVEDRWAGGLSAAARQAGGRVAWGERVSRARVELAVEAMEHRDEVARSDSGRGG